MMLILVGFFGQKNFCGKQEKSGVLFPPGWTLRHKNFSVKCSKRPSFDAAPDDVQCFRTRKARCVGEQFLRVWNAAYNQGRISNIAESADEPNEFPKGQ